MKNVRDCFPYNIPSNNNVADKEDACLHIFRKVNRLPAKNRIAAMTIRASKCFCFRVIIYSLLSDVKTPATGIRQPVSSFVYTFTVTSGSIFLISAFASVRIASNLSSGASSIIFWFIKFTDTFVTPSIFFTAVSIFAAQCPQSRSSNLIVFYIRIIPLS